MTTNAAFREVTPVERFADPKKGAVDMSNFGKYSRSKVVAMAFDRFLQVWFSVLIGSIVSVLFVSFVAGWPVDFVAFASAIAVVTIFQLVIYLPYNVSKFCAYYRPDLYQG